MIVRALVDVADDVHATFGDLGIGAEIVMLAIDCAESGVKSKGVLIGCQLDAEFDNYLNLNPATGRPWQPDPNSPARYDDGIPQINSQHGNDRTRLKRDSLYAHQCGRKVYDGRRGDPWLAWSTYAAGRHVQYIDEATAAVAAARKRRTPAAPVPRVNVPTGFYDATPGADNTDSALVRLEVYARSRGIAGSGGVTIKETATEYVVTVRKAIG